MEKKKKLDESSSDEEVFEKDKEIELDE